MAQLPKGLTLALTQTRWSALLNPFLANPSLQNSILNAVVLKNGTTAVNHLLGRIPQGWRICDINGAATIYRSQPFTETTITLTSNAAVTVSLEVF